MDWEHTFVFQLRRVLDAVAGRDAIHQSARTGRRIDISGGPDT